CIARCLQQCTKRVPAVSVIFERFSILLADVRADLVGAHRVARQRGHRIKIEKAVKKSAVVVACRSQPRRQSNLSFGKSRWRQLKRKPGYQRPGAEVVNTFHDLLTTAPQPYRVD